MKVPLLDLTPQYAQIKSEVDEVIAEVCVSQRFILGPYVTELEQAVARYCGSDHAIGMSSGTDALLVALMALDIGAGDAVITSPYTFFATAGTIARLGARPIFCDIDPQTFNISPAAVEYLLEHDCDNAIHRPTGTRIKAMMPVHLYGQLADMDSLTRIAARHDLPLIEDAAQAIGAEDGAGRRAGSIGAIGCLSFFPTKNLGGFGDGGMCTASDPALAERLKILRVHGMEPKYYHAFVGGNFRLDELQAAVLSVKLHYLDGWTAGRQRNAAFYDQQLADLEPHVQCPTACAGSRHVYNQYVLRVQRRDELRAFLQAAGIGTEIYYPLPLHLQQCFSYLGHVAGDFPEAERAASETLALPIYPELSDEQLGHVVAAIRRFYD